MIQTSKNLVEQKDSDESNLVVLSEGRKKITKKSGKKNSSKKIIFKEPNNVLVDKNIISDVFNPYLKTSKNKKVCILGTAPTIENTPFDNPEYDIWGVAHCCFLPCTKRLDDIFEIHKKEIWIKDNTPFHRFPNAKIWMIEKESTLPNSAVYPVKDILQKYAVNKGFENESYYMSSSLPFMIAMAIEQGYEEIRLYGIHLLMEEEYFYQRPCLERYIGIAEGKGIRVYTDPGADIMKFGYVYGIQEKENDDNIARLKARLEEFDKRIANITGQLNNANASLQAQLHNLNGAREQVIYDLRYLGAEQRKGYVKF